MDIILGKLKESWEGSWQQVLRGESGEDVLREGRERNGREMHVWDIELEDNLEGVNEDGFTNLSTRENGRIFKLNT